METGIYKFVAPDGKIYIGQAKNIQQRFNQYKWRSHQFGRLLSESFEKFGFESHAFDIVQLCSIAQLDNLERYYQELYDVCGDNGLNCKLTQTIDKPLYLRPETLELMSNVKLGKKFTAEHKAKIGASKIGKRRDPELMKRLVASRKPLVRTEEGKKSFNEKMKGHTFNRGKVRTAIQKEAMSRVLKERLSNSTHPTAKIVVDVSTGVFFDNAREAAIAFNINKSTLYAVFAGRLRNRTNLMYA